VREGISDRAALFVDEKAGKWLIAAHLDIPRF
jgi:hypothetical protein